MSGNGAKTLRERCDDLLQLIDETLKDTPANATPAMFPIWVGARRRETGR